jgi:hypothetical protein
MKHMLRVDLHKITVRVPIGRSRFVRVYNILRLWNITASR